MNQFMNVVALCVVLLGVAFLTSGCGALEKARLIYEQRADEAEKAYDAWMKAIDEAKEAERDWNDFKIEWERIEGRAAAAEAALRLAKESGDPDAIAKATKDAEDAADELKTLQAKGALLAKSIGDAAKYVDTAEDTYKASEDLLKAAKTDFENAKSADDYVGTVLGWLGLGLSTILGGGSVAGAVGTIRNKNRAKAVEGAAAKTAMNAKNSFGGDPEAWKAFLEAQEEAMTDKERAAFRKARGG